MTKPKAILGLAFSVGLIAAVFVVVSAYAVRAGVDQPITAEAAPFAESSGISWTRWLTVARGPPCPTFGHDLGREPEEYAVELLFLDTDGGLGLNRRYYGGAEEAGKQFGASWARLTSNTITICRGAQDTSADRILARVWVPPTSPAYDSEWTDINPGQTITLNHSLAITATDLSVGLWFSSTAEGIHHVGYGGLAIDMLQRMMGAHWHHLTDNSIQVTRHPHDALVEQVRVVIVEPDPPQYDSLEALGDWQDIAAGAVYTFEHNLNVNALDLVVRSECYSAALGGINQRFAGGNHDWFKGWQGANIQNQTNNTVQVYRQPDDEVCPQVRVRIWQRGAAHKALLPLLSNEYSP
jgi:hypothetical protein